MRAFVLAAVSGLFLSGVVHATSPKLSAKQLAINAFEHLQTAGLDKELVAQEKELTDEGLKANLEETDATLLAGQGGFAGTDHVYLVTTPFTRPGANPTTKVVAARVHANDYLQTRNVRKVLTQREIAELAGK